MSADVHSYLDALDRAHEESIRWLGSLDDRPVRPQVTAEDLRQRFSAPLPAEALEPADVVDELVFLADTGLMAMPSGRFFGWVIGGTLPAALAADWLVSAWDQNAGMRYATPAAAAIEEIAGAWLLDLLGLPAGSDLGFTTGATMANFVGLAAGRQAVLEGAEWDLDRDGLTGAPRVRVYVGEERHDVVDLALRYLGLGAPIVVPADEQGRIRPAALAAAMDEHPGEPSIVVLQVGNLHSGAFDPVGEASEIAHERGAWVHVDGAFGLWAMVSPALASLTTGIDAADSWATDAHKTLNAPYDCGIAVVRRPEVSRRALGVHTSYLQGDQHGVGDQLEKVPELSRRARGIPVWAALRSLGRSGVIALVDRLTAVARQFAEGFSRIEGATVVNDVVFTQVCVHFGSDERTRTVIAALLEEGETWMSGSRWRGRDVLRVSVSNWSTDGEDIRRSLDAVRRAAGVISV